MKKKTESLIRRFALKLGRKFLGSNPLQNPLAGDRCIEYPFVVKNLIKLDKSKYKTVLDIGCFASPLTTIIKEIGLKVDGIDLLPSPYNYEGINYMCGDFLSMDLNGSYDIVVLCSTIEHVGLAGRYGSQSMEDGDIKTLEKVERLLNPGGILILTIPYGVEKTIKPLHRVYNKNSKLLKLVMDNEKFEVLTEEFYKNSEKNNIWQNCTEEEAHKVRPSEDNHALGLFCLMKKEA